VVGLGEQERKRAKRKKGRKVFLTGKWADGEHTPKKKWGSHWCGRAKGSIEQKFGGEGVGVGKKYLGPWPKTERCYSSQNPQIKGAKTNPSTRSSLDIGVQKNGDTVKRKLTGKKLWTYLKLSVVCFVEDDSKVSNCSLQERPEKGPVKQKGGGNF